MAFVTPINVMGTLCSQVSPIDSKNTVKRLVSPIKFTGAIRLVIMQQWEALNFNMEIHQ